jgi:voltage-gated potassium channel
MGNASGLINGTVRASPPGSRAGNVQSLVETIRPSSVAPEHGVDPLLQASPRRGVLARDLVMVALALFSIGILVYDELRHPTGLRRKVLIWTDFVIVLVFVGEFVVRYRTAHDKKEFLKRTWYEIPGMLPMALGELSFLRFFRLFRILAMAARLWRANRVAKSFLGRSHLLTILGVAALLLFGAAYAEYLFERNSPQGFFPNFYESLWWAIVTTTTVGYGDKYPVTLGGRVVAGILMLTGIGLIGTLAATFSAAMLRTSPASHAAKPLEERLGELARLRSSGALSEAEFQLAKERVLRES